MQVRNLGREDYQLTWSKMVEFTTNRAEDTVDELWVVEHNPVFTQGISGKEENILSNTDIPIIKTDRGGQVTYHGPGQLIIYCLIDLKRKGIGVKKMVSIIENSVVELLNKYRIKSHLKNNAPGVYVDNKKISALGLKVKNGKTYHGLSLNIEMDLTPFMQINPCGYPGLEVTQVADLTDNVKFDIIANELSDILIKNVSRN